MLNMFRKADVAIRAVLIAMVCYVPGIYAQSSFCCPTSCCGQGFLSGEFLYWRAYEGGLDECRTLDSCDITTHREVSSTFKGKRNDPHFEWNPGYRAGVGYQFARGWDIAAYWTEFHSRAEGFGIHKHERKWKLNFEVADILIGYSFEVYPCFTIRPFAGVRGAKIDQSLKVNQSSCCLSTYLKENNSEKFTGIGPLLGIEANLQLGCDFGLYADIAVATLFGNYNVHFKKAQIFNGSSSFCNLRQHLNAYQGVVDAAFGISWQRCFCNNMMWLFKLGVEHHCYFNHNRIGNYGNLYLDGGTFSASLAF